MNYRELLRKYIEYIRCVEGTDFLGYYMGNSGDQDFDSEEWMALQSLTREGAPDAPPTENHLNPVSEDSDDD